VKRHNAEEWDPSSHVAAKVGKAQQIFIACVSVVTTREILSRATDNMD
jgi:hypothetical protein